MRLPTNNKITFPYGATSAPYSASNPHAGVDYSRWPNQRVYAPERMKITFVGEQGACGKSINATGQDGRTYRFCHLHGYTVEKGQSVDEGKYIGLIGDTGFAFGAHLHFVMWVYGKRVAPDKTLRELIKGEDMYKGKSAEEWYKLYNTTLKERNIFKKTLVKIRDLTISVIGSK